MTVSPSLTLWRPGSESVVRRNEQWGGGEASALGLLQSGVYTPGSAQYRPWRGEGAAGKCRLRLLITVCVSQTVCIRIVMLEIHIWVTLFLCVPVLCT